MRIYISVIPYSIYNFSTLRMTLEHLINGIDVILQISVEGDGTITPLLESVHKTCEECILMSRIMR